LLLRNCNKRGRNRQYEYCGQFCFGFHSRPPGSQSFVESSICRRVKRSRSAGKQARLQPTEIRISPCKITRPERLELPAFWFVGNGGGIVYGEHKPGQRTWACSGRTVLLIVPFRWTGDCE
jgi:hypothetical protein